MATDPLSTNPPEPSRASPKAGAPRDAKRRLTLLAVDDSASDLNLLSRAVREVRDWEVELLTSSDAAECLSVLESRAVDVLLVDCLLGAVNGVQLLREIRQTGAQCPVIFLTGRGDARVAVEALQAGAADFMCKDDLSGASLKRAVEAAIERRNLQLAITEYRKRLERAKESLERRNVEIQGFYRTITRELATPLSAALEQVSALLDGSAGPLEPEQSEIVESVKDSCGQIALCLNDVLEIGRLESDGKLSLWLRPDDLSEVVQRAAATLAPRAESLGVHLEVRVGSQMRAAVMDRQRITQVLANLVENALEFTPAGGRIEIESGEDPCDPAFLSVSVTDTGPGLSDAEVQKLLASFCETDPANARAAALGRGLSLCREIVRLHGGEISVQSEPGSGTTFSFTLVQAHPEADVATSARGAAIGTTSARSLS